MLGVPHASFRAVHVDQNLLMNPQGCQPSLFVTKYFSTLRMRNIESRDTAVLQYVEGKYVVRLDTSLGQTRELAAFLSLLVRLSHLLKLLERGPT